MLFTPQELQDILKPFQCDFPFPSNLTFNGITFDSRLIKKDDLFLALPGQKDGHLFVKESLEKGAAGAMVSRLPSEVPLHKLIQVTDCYQALSALSVYARKRTSATIAAVTGSVGKTTVKEGLSFVLSRQQSTIKSPKTYNNDLGVPLSLVHLKADDHFGVFEVGMNHAGEIEPLAKIIEPHVAIITALGPVHIEHLKTMEAIALEKSALFSGAAAGGTAIIPTDTPFYDFLKSQAQHYGLTTVVGFGKNPQGDIVLQQVESYPSGQKITALWGNKLLEYKITLNGEHNVLNSLAILAAVQAMGADLEQAAQDIEHFFPVQGRGNIMQVPYKHGILTLLDESYNANLLSMKAALKNLANFPSPQGKKIAILGDMKELGEYSKEHHHQLIQFVAQLSIDKVAVCGPAMQEAYEQLPLSQKLGRASQVEDLLPLLKEEIKSGDVLMAKGSFSMKMNTIVTYFTEKT